MGIFKKDIEGLRKAREQQHARQEKEHQEKEQPNDEEKLSSIGERAQISGMYNASITDEERSWLFTNYPAKWDEFSKGTIK
ncbi:hypothetical protein [Enterococcus alishanensis]